MIFRSSFLLPPTLLLLARTVHTLDNRWAMSIADRNCTSFISSPNSEVRKCTDSKSYEDTQHSNSTDSPGCPPWYQVSESNVCQQGLSIGEIVVFQKYTGQTWLEVFNCMTTTDHNRTDVVGGCIFTAASHLGGGYFPLPCNISDLNEFMCAGLNREGQLCGRCKKGFAPPVYSYSLSCVKCTNYRFNWLKYLLVSLGPLTLFSIFVILFPIGPTSPYLHGYIFYCHIISMPSILRLIVVSNAYQNYHKARLAFQIYSSLLGIWNLDFFRLVYEPFCIHPQMTIIQALSLDYITASYPLVLVCSTYFLTYLYKRNFQLVVKTWRLIRIILRPFQRNLNIQTSLIQSFATLYLLSFVKFQSVTLDLLVPTTLLYVDGGQATRGYLYLAGDVEYFGQDHLPYAVLATVVFIIVVIIPTFLLFLYPCVCCQQCLNKLHCNYQALRTFMDVFQGHYKNRTDKSCDFRYFSGVYFLVRTLLVITLSALNSYYSFIVFGIILTVFGFTVAVLHPQLTKLHHITDSFFLLSLSVVLSSFVGLVYAPHNAVPLAISHGLCYVAAALPIFFITALFLYWLLLKLRVLP